MGRLSGNFWLRENLTMWRFKAGCNASKVQP
jgi:hypothetical protein